MEWLTPHEAFVFETHGLCVVEDVVPAEDLAAMNQWRGPRIGHNACHSPCRASPLRPPAHHQRKDGQRSRARVLPGSRSCDRRGRLACRLDAHPDRLNVRGPEQV